MTICNLCSNNSYIFINDHISCFKNNYLEQEKIDKSKIFNYIYLAIKNDSYDIYEYLIKDYYIINNKNYTIENYLDLLSNVLNKEPKYLLAIFDIIKKYRYETLIYILNEIYILDYDLLSNNIKYILQDIDYSELNYNTCEVLLNNENIENIYNNKYYIKVKNEILQSNILELIDFYFSKICIFKPKYYNYVNNFDTFMYLINNNYKIDKIESYPDNKIISINNAKDIRIINYLFNTLKVDKLIIDKILLEYMKCMTIENRYFKKIYIYFLSHYNQTIYEILTINKWSNDDYEKYKKYIEEYKDEELINSLKIYFLKCYDKNYTFKYAFKLLENKYSLNLIDVNNFINNKHLTLLNYILEKGVGYITFNRKLQDVLQHNYFLNNIPVLKLIHKYCKIDKINNNVKKDALKMLEEKEQLNNILEGYNIYDKCNELINSLFII